MSKFEREPPRITYISFYRCSSTAKVSSRKGGGRGLTSVGGSMEGPTS